MSVAPRSGPTVRLVLGDQLNPRHSWYAEPRADVLYVLMEVRSETDYVLHHAQKILGIFAAMRAFATHLEAHGHRVRYIAIDDRQNRQSLTENLRAVCNGEEAAACEYQEPDEWRVDRELAAFAASAGRPCRAVGSEHFYTERGFAGSLFAGRRSWRLEHFYRRLRVAQQVLVDAQGSPAGGSWNYDAENRKRWNGTPAERAEARATHDHRRLWDTIQSAGVKSFGDPAAGAFRWPLDRAEALAQFDHFVEHGLPYFGDFQDAMDSGAPRLFHALVSFALNLKMLDPRELVARAVAAYEAGAVPLAAAEGFIRQILGWREYVRGVYWARMPGYTASNVFGHARPLPGWFWTGATRMRCLQLSIGQSLADGYAHHIQRLMVIGNFALLAGIDPGAVHRWYLGVYVDAFEWVEAPNTLGMSQFADGGLVASKPYVSSAAYIDKMGDYCRGCPYDRKARTGPRACPFNALYWNFFMANEKLLGGNSRLALVYRQLERMDAATRGALVDEARRRLADVEAL